MKRHVLCVSALVAALGIASASFAVSPGTMNFQGILTDGAGTPLDGLHDIEFAIYADSGAATDILWSETHLDLPVNAGVVDVVLGMNTPLTPNVFAGAERWLAMYVDGGDFLEPLTRLTSVPWSVRSAVADSAVVAPATPDADWLIVGDHIRAANPGNVGIGTNAPVRRLQVDGASAENGIRIAWGSGYPTVYGDIIRATGQGLIINSHAGGGTWADINFQTNAVTRMYLTHNGRLGIGTTAPEELLHVDGTAKVDVLKITGADVAEHFPVREVPEPGEVVVIDADEPGTLCRSERSYDRRVAGVISGAGDLPTGAVLGELPDKGTTAPVALTGRVWVKCTVADSPIEPGDLLTTSDVLGHAMKVIDHERAQGAILGKAMTALTDGPGLVLVLISLQ